MDNTYFNKLKTKYNYSSKTINALKKIIPCLINYYGDECESIILDAILNCEIIPCSSYQTISKIEKDEKLTLSNNDILENLEIKKSESAYLSNIKIIYDELSNTYKKEKLNRKIVTSHTYNYDSPKGLEVLTYALCKLIKSYKDEYIIDENKLIKRCGISYVTYDIINDSEIFLEPREEKFKALQEGLNIYDTEKIVSMALNYNYKCYDYDSLYVIAKILKENFNFNDLSYYEIINDTESFIKLCGDSADKLSNKCSECLLLEHEMIISMFRDEKDELANRINKTLSKDIYNILITIYENKNLAKDISYN